jgi:hypothetical protein
MNILNRMQLRLYQDHRKGIYGHVCASSNTSLSYIIASVGNLTEKKSCVCH